MKSSRKVGKSLKITTRNPYPDLLIEYHIEPLTGNKKPAEHGLIVESQMSIIEKDGSQK